MKIVSVSVLPCAYSSVREVLYAIHFEIAGLVSHTLLICVHGFRVLLTFVLSAKFQKKRN